MTFVGAGMHTIESFSGTNVVQVDGNDVTAIEKYVLLVNIQDYASYDATKVKVAKVPNTTISLTVKA